MRHLRFPINDVERDSWLDCMHKTPSEIVEEDELREGIFHALMALGDHMRNQSATGDNS